METTEEAEETDFDSAVANVTVLSGSMSSKLSQLKNQFPAGRYWNHKVTASHRGNKQYTDSNDPCNNPEGTTNHPCNTHDVSSNPSSLKNPHTGEYSCNYFDQGIQCSGYARTIFYKLHGKRVSLLSKKSPSSINEVAVGDFVQISSKHTSNHSLIVTSINKSRKTITGTDANNGNSCRISWDSSFAFNEIEYIVSPSSSSAGYIPGEGVMVVPNHFAHDPANTKPYILHFDTSESNVVVKYNDLTYYYKDNVYIPSDIIVRPGYRQIGWKIKLPNGEIVTPETKSNPCKIGNICMDGSILGSGSCIDGGPINFGLGDAFCVNEGSVGDVFTLIPTWLKDSDESKEPVNPFDDVKQGDWYYDWVVKSNAAGLMTGLNSTHFGPNDKMSRAMVATVLYRMAGSPNVSDTQIFPDVPAGQWYSKAIKWANEKKVATGYENGKFGPDDNITREQLATMICRYQRNVAGKSTSDKASLDKFPDKKNVNDFARESVQYCVAKGIITGSHGNLLPVDNATRAECAKMLLVAKDAK